MTILFLIFWGLISLAAVYHLGKVIFRSKSKKGKWASIPFLIVFLSFITTIFLEILKIISPQVLLVMVLIMAVATLIYLSVKQRVKKSFQEFPMNWNWKIIFRLVVIVFCLGGALGGIGILSKTALIPNWTETILSGIVVLIFLAEFFKLFLFLDEENSAAPFSLGKELEKKFGNVKAEILFTFFLIMLIPAAIGYFIGTPFIELTKKLKK